MIAPFDRITNEMPGCQGYFFVCLFGCFFFFCFLFPFFFLSKKRKKKIETKRFLNDYLHGIKLPVVV